MNRLLIITYEIALWLFLCLSLPKLIYEWIVYKKYRHSLLERLGFQSLSIKKLEGPLIWIHAVSVGETKAVVSLARELKKEWSGCQIIVSSITETGHAEAKRSLPFADCHLYLPFDLHFIMRRLLAKTRPDLVILCESDFWYNFLRLAKENGALIALVNGKISERSMKRFSHVPFFSKPLFNLLDVICVQNSLYEKRFIEAGAPKERLVVTGNLKLDEEYPRLSDEEIKQWRQRLGISCEHIVLTIGSTHAPEESIFIQMLKEIWQKTPQLKVILVPRHPERFKEVELLLKKEGIPSITFTDINRRTGHEQVLLIDAMGMLRMCYQLSDIALVGGSYTAKVGGHNILEPCWYEKPVLFGPHMHTQFELVELVERYGVGAQVDRQKLEEILAYWLQDPAERMQVGKKGSLLITDLKGATKRTLNAVFANFKAPS